MAIHPLLTVLIANTWAAAGMAPEIASRATEKNPTAQTEFLIHFGAGATFLTDLKADSLTQDGQILSEFSCSWAPFGLTGEIGVDVAIGRQNDFFVRPNLKFFFVKHSAFSLFLEGTAAFWSHAEGSDWGGGGAIGLMTGIMEHLAIELRGSLLAFAGDAGPARQAVLLTETETPDFRLMPSVSLRMLARF